MSDSYRDELTAAGVATQDTVTQLVAAVRRVAREVPGAAKQIAAVCTGHDYSTPGKPKIDRDGSGPVLPAGGWTVATCLQPPSFDPAMGGRLPEMPAARGIPERDRCPRCQGHAALTGLALSGKSVR